MYTLTFKNVSSLTLGLILSRIPLWILHNTPWVRSPPIPKFKQWRGSNKSFHIGLDCNF